MLWFEICKLLIDIVLDYTAKYYLEENKFWLSGMIHKLASTPYYVDRGTEFIVVKSGSLHIQMLVVSIFPAPLCLWRIETWPTSNSPSNSAFIFPSLCLRLALFLCLSLSLRGCVPSARAVPRSKRLCLSMHFIPDFNKVYISETSVTIIYTWDNIIRKYLFRLRVEFSGHVWWPWRFSMTLFGLSEVTCHGEACLSLSGVQRKRKYQHGPCCPPSSQQPHF